MAHRTVDQIIFSSVPGAVNSTILELIGQRLSIKYANKYPGGIYVDYGQTNVGDVIRPQKQLMHRSQKYLACSTTLGMEIQQEEVTFLFDKLVNSSDPPVLSVRERCSGDAFGIFAFANFYDLRLRNSIQFYNCWVNWHDFGRVTRRGVDLARTVLSQYSHTLVIYLRESAELHRQRFEQGSIHAKYMRDLVNLHEIYYRCEGCEKLEYDFHIYETYDQRLITAMDVFNSTTTTISIVDIIKFDKAPERLADHIIEQKEEKEAIDQIEAAMFDMLSTWEDKFRHAIHMATLPIDTLLPVCSKVKMEEFLAQLDVVLAELRDDYRLFVCRYAPPPEDTLVGITLRFYVKRVLLVLERLKMLISYMITKRVKPDFGPEDPDGVMTFNAADRISYVEANHVPPHKLYHHKTGIHVAADLPHAITTRALYEHVCRFWGKRQISTNSGRDLSHMSTTPADQPDSGCFDNEVLTTPLSETTTIIYSNKFANDIIDYVCHLSSYPVVPPDLKGILRSTLDDDSVVDAQNLPLGTPGPDSRHNVTNIASPRACIWCKTENTAIGHTDVTEQAKRARCQCIFSNTITGTEYKAASKINPCYFEGAQSTRATIMTRISRLNRRGPKNFGLVQSQINRSRASINVPGHHRRPASMQEEGEIEIHHRDAKGYCSDITSTIPLNIYVVEYRNVQQKRVIVEYIYQFIAAEMGRQQSIYPFKLKAKIDIERPCGSDFSLMTVSTNNIPITCDAEFKSRLHQIIDAINTHGPPMTRDGVDAVIFLEATKDKVKEGVLF
ncbi:PREDICTED: uncharacterized protein LOC109473280 [Branchiostoma belcheri]|uniref:Uncharacterized protein LOC109473280 n=1 Tax=Branchiostoma belcheri TaxID=7741 RepID=A0A6P4YHE2_BRABE|nr:PREDICTED: uncharacterized protein LOC109473280 [Branchiostoma belcheri]